MKSYKYLGLMLDSNFNWKEHLEKILEKARKRTRALCAMGVRKGVEVEGLASVGTTSWSMEQRFWERRWKQAESLQMKMGVSKLTTREVIQGELGLSTVASRRIVIRIRFWTKIIRCKRID